MKRLLSSAAVFLMTALLLAGSALAAVTPGRYTAISCEKDGNRYKCDGEYLLLRTDGTGEVCFNDDVCGLTWTEGGESASGTEFSAIDDDGYSIQGYASPGQTIVATYVGFSYVYALDGAATEPFNGSVQDIAPDRWGSGLPRVFDQAGLLSDGELAQLTEKAQAIAEAYPCDVYVIILDDYTNYWNGSIERCAEEIRTGYDLGQGEDRDCIALIMSMSNRRYDVVIHGAYTHQIFPDGNREAIARAFTAKFRNDDWAGGFQAYLDKCEAYLKGNGREITPLPQSLIGALLPSGLIGLIFCQSQKRKMQAVAEQTRAGSYVAPDGCQITYRADHYTGTTVSRVYSPRKSSGSGGGSSSGGGGHSHTSGSF